MNHLEPSFGKGTPSPTPIDLAKVSEAPALPPWPFTQYLDSQNASDPGFLRPLYIDRSFAFSLSNSSGVRIPRSFSFSNSSRRWMRFIGGAEAIDAAGGGA